MTRPDPVADLAERREELSAEIGREREHLAQATRTLDGRGAIPSEAREMAERIAPLLLPVVIFLLLKPQRTVRWAVSAWGLWRTARRSGLADEVLARLGSRPRRRT
ncbi:MAG TPA: hypothetical protein VM369_04465 [Candidatus Binatia bacterium]|nr:hypothetical protein [Candidatus Binatia bacterium]